MFISRSQAGCLLLILLSISALHREVLGTRHLTEKVEDSKTPQVGKDGSNAENEGYYGAVKREVPSCPDPLHNR